MNKRENMLAALRRQNPEYVPFAFSLCPSLVEKFKQETGSDHDDYMSYFGMPFRYVNILPTRYPADYSRYYPDLPAGAQIDEWGEASVPSGHFHFSKPIYPMADFSSIEQVLDFPLPDVLADYRWDGFADHVQAIKNQGLAPVYSAIQIFEMAWGLRGMENLLMDMMSDDGMARACLDRLTHIKTGICRRLAEADVDMIVYGDDVGTQKAMMMDPNLWRKWLKPGMAEVIQAAREIKPDILCYYHSDGVIDAIIPDLIEIGVDVLNPVQPECMDPVQLKQLYGDRLSFWGTIGTQTTMPFGSPQDVEKAVAGIIRTVGKGGGLVVAPSHLLEPEVPWENILAFVHAMQKYGKY